MTPSRDKLREALVAAGGAHHDYEQGTLGGQRDALWSGFYAAYVLGRLGDFASPTELAAWLEAAPEADDWAGLATDAILSKLA
jgi:hypothetical protein